MREIKFYDCPCGEEFYEDDIECVNCGVPVDQTKFKTEKLYEITQQGPITEVEMPLNIKLNY